MSTQSEETEVSTELEQKDQQMVNYVEDSVAVNEGDNLVQKTKDIEFNVMDEELEEVNQALKKAKDKMNLVPQPKSSVGKFFNDKFPKLYVWVLEAVANKEFADANSLEKVEVLMAKLDETFARLRANFEPTRELKNRIEKRVEAFERERDKVQEYIDRNPETPSKEFLELHIKKLDGTIEVLKQTALVWLANNLQNRLKMYASAMSERNQLEVTLVAGLNTLRATREVEKAAETQQAMRDLTNQIQQQAAKANTRMEKAVADVTTSTIFTEETIRTIQEEEEKAKRLVEETKQKNAQEIENLDKMLDEYEPMKTDQLEEEAYNVIEQEKQVDADSDK